MTLDQINVQYIIFTDAVRFRVRLVERVLGTAEHKLLQPRLADEKPVLAVYLEELPYARAAAEDL